MKPPVWRFLAVSVGVLLFIATLLDCYAAVFANGDGGFSGEYDRAQPGTVIVKKITDPTAVDAPLRLGDRVRLEDSSLAHRLDFARQQVGDRFVFVGTTKDGNPLRFTDTIRPAKPPGTPFWIYELMRVTFIVVGLVVAVRRPADPVARRMVVLFLSLATLIEANGSWAPAWLGGFLVLVIVPFAQVFAAYAGLDLAVTFPQESVRGIRRMLQRGNPWLLAVTLAVAAFAIVATIVLLRRPPSWLPVAGAIVTLGYFAAIAVAFALALRGATGADKQRVRWVAYSLGVGFAGPLITYVLLISHAHLGGAIAYFAFSLIAIPLGLGYAIVRHRVVDIGFVVNRALVFGTVSAIVVIAFGALEWVLGTVLVRVSHVTSASLELGLALILGFSLRSIHGKVDAAVDDIFFRARHEAERALRTFAREVAYITDPRTAVARAHAELIAHTGASGAAIYVVAGCDAVRVDPDESAAADRVDVDDPALVRMRASRAPLALADVDSALNGDLAFPMCVRDAVTGTVVLEAKTSGEAYAPDEIGTVETVVLALGNALDALQTAALKAEIARVLLDGAPLETLRRTADPAGWVRGVRPQPAGSILGLE